MSLPPESADDAGPAAESDAGMLTVHVVYEGTTARLVAIGEIDASSARTFETAAHQVLAERPGAIEIDLADVEFIDSSGLRSIISLSNRASEQKIEANVTGLSSAARRVLEVTGLIDSLRRG